MDSLKFTVVDARNTDKYIELVFDMFSEHDVFLDDINSANAFLQALWGLFDKSLSPTGMPEKCPWAFIPFKMKYGKKSITYLGSVRTKIGFLHVAISYEKKGSIETIHFFSQEISLKVYGNTS